MSPSGQRAAGPMRPEGPRSRDNVLATVPATVPDQCSGSMCSRRGTVPTQARDSAICSRVCRVV
eukprot:3135635-Pyramimonas_sp.AAC.1